MKIDFKDMYLGRIDQINIDIKQAVWNKKWTIKAKLEAEKKIVQEQSILMLRPLLFLNYFLYHYSKSNFYHCQRGHKLVLNSW